MIYVVEINFNYNDFEYFPKYLFKNVTSLRTIHLKGNNFKTLSIDLNLLFDLAAVDLSYNLIETLEDGSYDLSNSDNQKSIVYLNLAYNDLRAIRNYYFVNITLLEY